MKRRPLRRHASYGANLSMRAHGKAGPQDNRHLRVTQIHPLVYAGKPKRRIAHAAPGCKSVLSHAAPDCKPGPKNRGTTAV